MTKIQTVMSMEAKPLNFHRGDTSNALCSSLFPSLKPFKYALNRRLFSRTAWLMPLAIMETVASGLSVITTVWRTLRDEFEDGITGHWISPGDLKVIAEATLYQERIPDSHTGWAKRRGALAIKGSMSAGTARRCSRPACIAWMLDDI